MYEATKEQLESFNKEHEYLKTKLDLGKEILWLTKDECIQAGPNVSIRMKMYSSMQCLHMYQALWHADANGSNVSHATRKNIIFHRPQVFRL